MIKSINPATDEVLAQFGEIAPAAIEQRLAVAQQAQQQWRHTPVAVRAGLLRRVAATLHVHRADYAPIMTLEMGKPLNEARGEIAKCALNFEFSAEHAEPMKIFWTYASTSPTRTMTATGVTKPVAAEHK